MNLSQPGAEVFCTNRGDDCSKCVGVAVSKEFWTQFKIAENVSSCNWTQFIRLVVWANGIINKRLCSKVTVRAGNTVFSMESGQLKISICSICNGNQY